MGVRRGWGLEGVGLRGRVRREGCVRKCVCVCVVGNGVRKRVLGSVCSEACVRKGARPVRLLSELEAPYFCFCFLPREACLNDRILLCYCFCFFSFFFSVSVSYLENRV